MPTPVEDLDKLVEELQSLSVRGDRSTDLRRLRGQLIHERRAREKAQGELLRLTVRHDMQSKYLAALEESVKATSSTPSSHAAADALRKLPQAAYVASLLKTELQGVLQTLDLFKDEPADVLKPKLAEHVAGFSRAAAYLDGLATSAPPSATDMVPPLSSLEQLPATESPPVSASRSASPGPVSAASPRAAHRGASQFRPSPVPSPAVSPTSSPRMRPSAPGSPLARPTPIGGPSASTDARNSTLFRNLINMEKWVADETTMEELGAAAGTVDDDAPPQGLEQAHAAAAAEAAMRALEDNIEAIDFHMQRARRQSVERSSGIRANKKRNRASRLIPRPVTRTPSGAFVASMKSCHFVTEIPEWVLKSWLREDLTKTSAPQTRTIFSEAATSPATSPRRHATISTGRRPSNVAAAARITQDQSSSRSRGYSTADSPVSPVVSPRGAGAPGPVAAAPPGDTLSGIVAARPVVRALMAEELAVVKALCSAIAQPDQQDLAVSLVRVFEQQNKSIQLINWAITAELSHTLHAETLFRSNSIASKMMSAYARLIGIPFLGRVLKPLVTRVCALKEPLEVDPSRLGNQPPATVERNTRELQELCRAFVAAIVASLDDIPVGFRILCRLLADAVQHRFSSARYFAIGGFFFLRFMVPAVVAPETYDLCTASPSGAARRTLVLISKVLQNLANGVKFGGKEAFMVDMNAVVDEQLPIVQRFFDGVTTISASLPAPTPHPIHKLVLKDSITRVVLHLTNNLEAVATSLDNVMVTEDVIFLARDRLLHLLAHFDPRTNSEPLVDMLLEINGPILPIILQVADSAAVPEIGSGAFTLELDGFVLAMVRVFEARHRATELIGTAARQHMQQASGPPTSESFFGSGVAFKLLASYARLTAPSYTSQTLAALINNRVCNMNRPLEIDPRRVSAEEAQANMTVFRSLAETFVHCILDTQRTSFPRRLQRVLAVVKREWIAHKGDVAAFDHILADLIFVRLLCPAIAAPEGFDIVNVAVNPEARRILLFLSKFLRNFAFNVAFEQREAFLMPLNDIIERKQPALRQFFASISTDPGGAGTTAAPVMPWRLNPDDLAAIHEFVMSRVGPIADRLGDATNTQKINYKLFDRVTAVVAQYRVYN